MATWSDDRKSSLGFKNFDLMNKVAKIAKTDLVKKTTFDLRSDQSFKIFKSCEKQQFRSSEV
jgi:hypothetical protein